MFKNGYFPDSFKLAHVTCIWKQKGVKSLQLFYRTISLLPSMSKCMESVIHSSLLSHLFGNNIISIKQAAYLKGDSTTNQLIYIVHKIRSAWQQGNIVQGSFMDVDGAFEKVWHKGLIAK